MNWNSILKSFINSGENHYDCIRRLIYETGSLTDASCAIGVNVFTMASYMHRMENGLESDAKDNKGYLEDIEPIIGSLRELLRENGITMEDCEFMEWLKCDDAQTLLKTRSIILSAEKEEKNEIYRLEGCLK